MAISPFLERLKTGDGPRIVLFVLASLFVIWPVLATEIPPLIDYPNHLARMHILRFVGEDEVLASIYQTNWRPIPNLAMDLIVPPLSHLTGVEWASRIFLMLAILMPVAGTLTLRKVLVGQVGYVGLGAFVCAYTLPLAWGFLNFSFGTGLALLVLAGWIRYRDRSWLVRFFAFNLAMTAVYLSHLLALAGLVILIAIFELYSAWKSRALRPDRLAWRALPVIAMFALPLALYVWQLVESGGTVPAMQTGSWFGDVATKYYAFLSGIYFYGGWIDAITLLFIAGVGVTAHYKGRLGFEARGLFLLAGLSLVILVLPHVFKGVFLDVRLGVFLLALLIASVRIEIADIRYARGLVVGSVLLTGVMGSQVQSAWAEYQRPYTEFRQAMNVVAPGSRVLSVHHVGETQARLTYVPDWRMSSVTRAPGVLKSHAYRHALTLSIPDRSIFVAELFTQPSAQPVMTAPAHARLDPIQPSRRLSVTLMQAALDPELKASLLETASAHDENLYWIDWPESFDYAVVFRYRPELRDNPAPDHLELIGSGSFFDIYEIRS